MFYYEIAIAERTYGGNKFLTYSCDQELDLGQIVVVMLRTKKIKGIVIKDVKKPNFNVKSIEKIYEGIIIPSYQIKFFELINEYYPGSLGSTASLFVPNLGNKSSIQDAIPKQSVVKKYNKQHKPTNQQQAIISKIISSNSQTHIIHGDTGTGKTFIYKELVNEMNNKNMSTIILTPEISLTPQLAEQFMSSFSNVYIIHSMLTPAEKRKIWLDILASKGPCIVLGPRSAMFAPVKDLGLIVIDEFHDSAYKQDQNPKYRTARLAGILSKICSSKLVLGSATPPIDDYYYALRLGSEIHRLTEKSFNYSKDVNIDFVKINDPSQKTKYDLITQKMINEIKKCLDNNQQVLVFHNKRGTSRTVLCEKCGNIESCERCNIPYVYHNDKNMLVCHTCNSRQSINNNCTKCGSESVLFKNPGTKSIEESLTKIFPSAKIGRYDKDNTKSETFSANYTDIKSGNVQILIGTQVLTKGHDLPKLALVIVLLANSNLQFPDFSAEERNYQQLNQVLGRVGRGHTKGRAMVQYFDKNNDNNSTEQKIDTWDIFYDKEINNRRSYDYPPFSYLLKIESVRGSQSSSMQACDRLAKSIEQKYRDIIIIGPSPALVEKKNNKWHWQIIIKSKKRKTLTEIAKNIPSNFSYDLDPINLL